MTTTMQHAPGTFCWPELATTDYPGAKAFYTGLFGWGTNEQDMGGGMMYGMWRNADRDAGAFHKMDAAELAASGRPHWNSYVAVASADETAAKAKQLGGKLMMEPFDVMEHGRMAIIQDPTGAVVCVWQGKKNAGVGVLDEPGSLCWTELMTRDTAAAAKFYSSLLPWKTEAKPMGPNRTYTVFKRGDQPAAGMMEITPEMGKQPPVWVVYFAVADCSATAAKAKQLGGSWAVEPTDVPTVGRFAVLVDPQGAHFGILGPAPKA